MSSRKNGKDMHKHVLNFFVPKKALSKKRALNYSTIRSAAVIPTYKPTTITYKLVESIVKFNPETQVVIVDDCTPLLSKNLRTLQKIKKLARKYKQVTYLRTPVNALKAGALNFGITHLLSQKVKPHVIFTSDDDVKIAEDTFLKMITSLYSDKNIGAACSLAMVKNKNANVLTRLQSLEYHQFNMTRISDNGFLQGPLVMHGMLTAFRTTALKQVVGFTEHHLIEDYEITVRLKNKGWQVKVAPDARAWTIVPEDLSSLWKQRVRWCYGGLGVVLQYRRNVAAIFSDLLGHGIFMALFFLILISVLMERESTVNLLLVFGVISIAIINFMAAFAFNLVALLTYPKRDRIDWFLKLGLIPELIYCNFLTLILLGSYLFYVYNWSVSILAKKVAIFLKPYKVGLAMFSKIGFSSTWGTRQA